MNIAIGCSGSENICAIAITGEGSTFSVGGDLKSFSQSLSKFHSEAIQSIFIDFLFLGRGNESD
ncbi:hypothetical protein [Oceanobacillus damuensis]|uniref:hypothetical protein n=1 Tax=Oceanobacillus damuensis TaxID=937928 RepID=UPI0012EDCEB6|nr:hypothetical protein [Oceanobacillus damuensis]